MPPRPSLPPLLLGIVEAVHDRDDHVLRRLLAQFAEQATIDDLYTLREALPRTHSRMTRHPPLGTSVNPTARRPSETGPRSGR